MNQRHFRLIADARPARLPSAGRIPAWLRPAHLVVMLALTSASAAHAAVVTDTLDPIPGTTNQAPLSLKQTAPAPAGPVNQTMIVQSGSTIGVAYDTTSGVLTVTSANLIGNNLTFTFGTFVHPCVRNAVVSVDTASAQYPPQGQVDNQGNFSMLVPVKFSGKVGNNCNGDEVQYNQTVNTPMQGNFTYDPDSGFMQLTDFETVGTIPPLTFNYSTFTYQLSGTVMFNFSGGVSLDALPSAQPVGSAIALTGAGITSGSLLKIFVATSNGVVDVIPNGLAPTSTTYATWNGTLPFPWPVGGQSANILGNGFVSMFLVRSDKGFDSSNLQGAVLLGNAGLGVPSITQLGGIDLSATSSELSIATANVEGVIARGAPLTITGSGFASPVVNIFTASGNVGPLSPTSSSGTSVTVDIPANAPIGPGSVQVVNATGSFFASNAVSMPIGELVTISSVEVNGNTITVNGTGFNSLTVINLFAGSGGNVINAGGLSGGSPNIPLTIVNNTQFTFTRPNGLDAGAAFVEAINPPFIPFASSGTNPAGAFVLP